MRPIITFSLLIIGISLSAQSLDWQNNFEESKRLSNEQSKNILLVFSGSDWCLNCIRLEKQFFESEEFKAYASKKLILQKADFPMKKKNQLPDSIKKQNEILADKYNKKGHFPLVLLLNAKGEVITTLKTPQSNNEAYLTDLKDASK